MPCSHLEGVFAQESGYFGWMAKLENRQFSNQNAAFVTASEHTFQTIIDELLVVEGRSHVESSVAAHIRSFWTRVVLSFSSALIAQAD